MSSVAKSIVDPFNNDKETASMTILDGFIVGWENTLCMGQ